MANDPTPPADPTQAVLDAFAEQGTLLDADVLDEHLAEVADKASGTLLRVLTGTEDGSIAALSDLLTVTRALRATLGYAPSPTAKMVIAEHRRAIASGSEGALARLLI
jgi:hypothetical protein